MLCTVPCPVLCGYRKQYLEAETTPEEEKRLNSGLLSGETVKTVPF